MGFDNVLRSRDIEISPGYRGTIETNIVPLVNRKYYILFIGTAFPCYNGDEAARISIDGNDYPLIDNHGNIITFGRLRDGKLDGCGNIITAKYRLSFGYDGMPCGNPHFVVHDGLAPMIYNVSCKERLQTQSLQN